LTSSQSELSTPSHVEPSPRHNSSPGFDVLPSRQPFNIIIIIIITLLER